MSFSVSPETIAGLEKEISAYAKSLINNDNTTIAEAFQNAFKIKSERNIDTIIKEFTLKATNELIALGIPKTSSKRIAKEVITTQVQKIMVKIN